MGRFTPGEQRQIHVVRQSPETGATVLEPYCFSVRMLRPGEEIAPKADVGQRNFHVIEGNGESLSSAK